VLNLQQPTPPTTQPHTTALEEAEATAGAYRLAYDHLATVTAALVNHVTAAIGPAWPVPVHGGTREALATVRNVLSRDLDSYLAETPEPNYCRCTWLGQGTPEHPHNSLCLTPEQDTANRARAAAASSVPPVRTQEARQRTPADTRTTRAVLGPLRQVSPEPAWTPVQDEDWGPYETELAARLAPMPVAVRELHDAGLIRSGDPEGLVRNIMLAHLVTACEAAGIRRGTYDDRILEWLARGETSAVQVVIGLVRRAATGADTFDQAAAEPAVVTEAGRG
jgi:hypothetical protein